MPPALPLPPPELRALVGPRDDEDFDNPTGAPVYPHLAPEAYRSVFDFGCGCGRVARRLIQQTPQPGRYVGVDPHRGLVAWAAENLTPAAPAFAFAHHDVYSPGYAPGNSLKLAERFPVADGSVSLLIAHSVFTHLSRDQAGFYLAEVARVLAADGAAFTTWLFFDNASMPFLPDGPHALYADEKDFSAAVLYDRRWFLDAARRAGLAVRRTVPPTLPGHQWEVWLGKRAPGNADQFPLGADGAEFVCGATLKVMAPGAPAPEALASGRTGSRVGELPGPSVQAPAEPALYGALAELAAARQEVETWKRRATLWRAARKVAGWVGVR